MKGGGCCGAVTSHKAHVLFISTPSLRSHDTIYQPSLYESPNKDESV